MKSLFDPKRNDWMTRWPGRISRHNLVYQAPPRDPMEGIPLGNGDVGVLAWCEDCRIVMALNKCDLWDDAETMRFCNWLNSQEEHSTTLRHAGRLVIDFGIPLFDTFYITDSSACLDLAHAEMRLAVETTFGSVEIDAFVAHDEGVLCVDVDVDLVEKVQTTVRLECYGSRTFSHWYALVNRDPRTGLSRTRTRAGERGVFITRGLSTGSYAVGCVAGKHTGCSARSEKEHSRAGRIVFSGSRKKRFGLVAGVTSPGNKQLSRLSGKLTSCDISAMKRSHRKAWRAFWERSFMEYGDDYLDNLWHLTMYYAYASQRGQSPGRFINGLWGWNRDVQNWNFYFHWNQQQTYWPLNAAGHHDLVTPYLEYRFSSLPHARRDARECFGARGAFVSDVCDRRGCNSSGEQHNHTPIAQIALDFWRQYRYTGDPDFLRSRVVPYMLEAARFFESLFEKGSDGRYHAGSGTAYEGWIKLRDVITDLSCARALFSAVLEALDAAGMDDPGAPRWRELLEGMAEYPFEKPDTRMLKKANRKAVLKTGAFKGDVVPSDYVFFAGYSLEDGSAVPVTIPGKPMQDQFQLADSLRKLEFHRLPDCPFSQDISYNRGVFPAAGSANVFPHGEIGLSRKGSDLFDIAVSTAKLSSPGFMGWDPNPVVLARLGLGKELAVILDAFPGLWQFYRNGWGHYGPMDKMLAESSLPFRIKMVRSAELGREESCREENMFPFRTWPFRHMGMESMSVLACAMNEALLQSHDEIIRVAPAMHAQQNARFTLHAAGGFVVSAEINRGRPGWICVRSLRGNTLRLLNPWRTAFLRKRGCNVQTTRARTIVTDTRRNQTLLIVPEKKMLRKWTMLRESPAPNSSPKTSADGRAMLGLPRMF